MVHLERNWLSRYLVLAVRKARKEGCLGFGASFFPEGRTLRLSLDSTRMGSRGLPKSLPPSKGRLMSLEWDPCSPDQDLSHRALRVEVLEAIDLAENFMASKEASAEKAEARAIFFKELLSDLGSFLCEAASCAQMKAARAITEEADWARKAKEEDSNARLRDCSIRLSVESLGHISPSTGKEDEDSEATAGSTVGTFRIDICLSGSV